MTDQDMQALFAAFNRHDIDAVMSHFHDDIVFETVAGAETYGTRITGKLAVGEQFENTWGTMPDVQWRNGKHFFVDDKVVSESTFVATLPDGKRVHADGVDIFTLRDGKIVGKQAFRKQRPPFDPTPQV
ncbi:taurine dehydrogenase small subunit [Modicisalibacter ilicicola DSM 19980]|uniref:Taurine dehydrogenase small subunit n=1 Tax=Modicisalibacter ilicicola DSM 19980 TaxID=1121942 RepID=A0A1M4WJL4_9GAMM|nr:nuclear transport factor 2 family protein [Halomonas ilicicola]SHE81182.1 taurine dehydrogenase small subunit [Halomonas ilicicola DSM 19980]